MSTQLAAIVNVTPDSFSDGGACWPPERALSRIETLIEEGADVIDIGAESTRPGAVLLSAQEEWERLGPVLPAARRLASHYNRVLSVDTRHAENAARALTAGADWINDVTGFSDPAMVTAVKGSRCKLIVMHSLGVPADAKRHIAEDKDPVAVVLKFFQDGIAALEAQGIARERLILDSGIGFGKTAQQSLQLLSGAAALQSLGCPLLVGHSRKSFLSLYTERPAADRDDLTLAFSSVLMQQGVSYLRVHEVARHRALREKLGAAPVR